MAGKKKAVDWVKLEIDYRAGVKTIRTLESDYGISKARIGQIANEKDWDRDLAPKIKAKAQAKLDRAILDASLDNERKITETEVVEAVSSLSASVQLSHRADLKVLKGAIVGMAGELGALSNSELQEALDIILDEKIDAMSAAQRPALRKAFDAALALGGRSTAGRNLVTALATLIDKERVAYGIDKHEGPKSIGEFLSELK